MITDDFILTNIASYRKNGNQMQGNIDYDGIGAVPSVILTQDARKYDHPIPQNSRWNEEVTLNGKLLEGRTDFVVGGFASGPATTSTGPGGASMARRCASDGRKVKVGRKGVGSC